MRRTLPVALLFASPAWGGPPHDVTISAMGEWDGAPLADPPEDEYRDLVTDLAAVVANPGALPAATTGAAGFDLIVQNTFGFPRPYAADDPTGWELSHPEGKPPDWTSTLGIVARKGLPWGFEVGGRGGWIAGSRQGVFGGFVRLAPLEHSKPAPDLAVTAGYASYVGNPELSMGVLDLDATIGSRFRLVYFEEVTLSHWEPWLTVSVLRVGATPRVSADEAARAGAVSFGGKDGDEPALWLLRYSAGFQVTTNDVAMRWAVDWAPRAMPTFTIGLGAAL